MSLAARWYPRLAILTVIALFAVRGEEWINGSLLAALVVGSGFLRRGARLDRTGQLAVMLVGLGLVWPALLALVPPDSGLTRRFSTGVILVGIFAALPRHFMAKPAVGERGNAALNMLALMGCSTGITGGLYAVFIVLFGGIQLTALRAVDSGRVPARVLSRRHRLALAAMVLITGAVGSGLTLSIPPAQEWAMHTFFNAFIRGRTGFSAGMDLGAMDDMYKSKEKVLRVFGPKPDHLRGVVYTRYRRGHWLEARSPTTRQDTSLPPDQVSPGARRTRIETLGGDNRRYFLPLRSRRISTDLGTAQVNAMGIFTTPPGERASQASFLPGRRDRFVLSPPGKDDLQLPRELAPRLKELARRWTPPGATPEQQLSALEGYLQRNFSYSLSFKRRGREDPLIQFLTSSKEGHCEYFASAMALLARAVGVPARVVGGYRVRERNELGGYYVVRERNAHSWVEAWVEARGWQTYDATPPAALARSSEEKMSAVGAFTDLLAARLRAAWGWVTGRTFFQLASVGVGLLAVWGLVRVVRGRRRARAALEVVSPLTYRDPLPALERLLEALASQGTPRGPSEPLESYAGRLDLEHGASAAAVGLLRRYAAWRFGGRGDPAELAEEMEQLEI